MKNLASPNGSCVGPDFFEIGTVITRSTCHLKFGFAKWQVRKSRFLRNRDSYHPISMSQLFRERSRSLSWVLTVYLSRLYSPLMFPSTI